MNISARNAAKPWGFTLVELLTVVAIIGVLATLLSASLGTAKRKARKTVSVSNLREIALALHMYEDDQRRRPDSFRALVGEKYLAHRVVLCPEDRTANWAGLLEELDKSRDASRGQIGIAENEPPPPEVPHSYFKSFDLPNEIWERIERSTFGGIAACQLHGLGRPMGDAPPSLDLYQGLVLRALKDGSVVQRQVFWDTLGASGVPPAAMAPANPTDMQLPLFLDPAE